MPTYQYACKDCGYEFEQVQSFSDPSLTVCPQCDGALRKVYGSVGVVFKGSGFYRTDSRSGSNGSVGPGQKSDSHGADKGSSKDAGGSDSGSSSGSSSDSGKGSASGSGSSASGSSGGSGSGASPSGASGGKPSTSSTSSSSAGGSRKATAAAGA